MKAHHITKAKERMNDDEKRKLRLLAEKHGLTEDQMIERLVKSVIYKGEAERLLEPAA